MDISGKWVFSQRWEGVPTYRFTAEFVDNRIEVEEGGGFYGTYQVLGSSSNIALAITSDNGLSVSAYVGNVVGGAMGGQMTGVPKTGSSTSGEWSAQRQEDHEAEMKTLSAPGE